MTMSYVEYVRPFPIVGIFCVVLCLQLFMGYINTASSKVSPKELELIEEIKKWRVEVKKYDSVDTFVKHAKAQRAMNKVVAQLESVREERIKDAEPSPMTKQVLKLYKPACLLIFTVLWWSTPVAKLNPDATFPVSHMLGFPWHESGAVGALAWGLICFGGTGRLLVAMGLQL